MEDLGRWLTTVVGRVCLDLLRSRQARREEPVAGPAAPAAGSGKVARSPTPVHLASAPSSGPFLAASRNGDFDALLALLDPGVVFRADRAARQAGAPAVLDGAATVASRGSSADGHAEPGWH